jgi:hypothetical protein
MLWNRIVTARLVKGVAADETLRTEPHASNDSMFFNCFYGVLRAGRVETAVIEWQQ